MSQSLAKILVHIIFSTEDRVDYLDDQIRCELYPYLKTVMQNLDCAVYALGGTQNHIHILCQFPKIIDVAKIIGKINRILGLDQDKKCKI